MKEVQEKKPVDETAGFEVVSSDVPVVEKQVEKKDDEPINSESKSNEDKPPQEETKKSDDNAESAKNNEPKKENGVQKRISKLVGERENVKRENEKLQKQIDELKKGKESKEKKALSEPKEDDVGEDGKPLYETYDEYLNAIDSYGKSSKEPEAKAPEKSDESKEPGLTDAQKTAMGIVQEIVNSAEKPKDFDEVALAEDVEVTGTMLEALAECDDPSKVLYHLGKNKAIATDIAKGTPAQQMRAIAKLDLSVKPPKPNKQSQAPEAISPVRGVDVHEKNNNDMSFSEYEEKRNKEERNRKNKGW